MNRTYEEWKKLGFQVTKGSKAVGKNDKGKAVFSKNQVTEDYCPEYDYEGSWEECLGDPYWYK